MPGTIARRSQSNPVATRRFQAEVVAAGGETVMGITGIPQDLRNIEITWRGRLNAGAAASVYVALEASPVGTNYQSEYAYAMSTGMGISDAFTSPGIMVAVLPVATSLANAWGMGKIWLPEYQTTDVAFRSFHSFGCSLWNWSSTELAVWRSSGFKNQSTPVTQVYLNIAGGAQAWAANSRMYLRGWF
jgi:hypothetical protein